MNSVAVRGFANDGGIGRKGVCEKGNGSREGVDHQKQEKERKEMSAEILSTPSSTRSSGFGAWLSDLEGRLRYQPWWIYITTLDRR